MQSGHEMMLDPLNNGPLGDMSRNPDVQGQTAALFPRNPPEGMLANTADAINRMASSNPQIALSPLRQHLANGFNSAARDAVAGPTGFGGAQFGRNIAGNSEQARNLMAGMRAAAPAAAKALPDLLDILRATGQRFPARSNSSFNSQDMADLAKNGMPLDAVNEASKFSVTRPLYSLRKGISAATTARSTSALIKLLQSDPETSAATLLQARRGLLHMNEIPYGKIFGGAAAQMANSGN